MCFSIYVIKLKILSYFLLEWIAQFGIKLKARCLLKKFIEIEEKWSFALIAKTLRKGLEKLNLKLVSL